jgi:hypothetical protein
MSQLNEVAPHCFGNTQGRFSIFLSDSAQSSILNIPFLRYPISERPFILNMQYEKSLRMPVTDDDGRGFATSVGGLKLLVYEALSN